MEPFEKRREASIKRAFLYVNKLKEFEQKKTFKIPFILILNLDSFIFKRVSL